MGLPRECQPRSESLQKELTNLQTAVESLRKELIRLKASATADATIWGTDFVTNVAAQVLLFCDNEDAAKSKHPYETFRFSNRARANDPALLGVSDALKKPVRRLAKTLDSVITDGNVPAHYLSWENLESDVFKAKSLLIRRPALAKSCADAEMVLKNYFTFKRFFKKTI